MEELALAVKQFGGWGVLIAVIVIIGRWLKPWAEKIFNAHIGLVEGLKDSQAKAGAALEAIAKGQEELKGVALSNSRLLTELHKEKGTSCGIPT